MTTSLPEMYAGNCDGLPVFQLTEAFTARNGDEMRDKIVLGLAEQTGEAFVHDDLLAAVKERTE